MLPVPTKTFLKGKIAMMHAKGDEFIKDFALRTKENYRLVQRGPYEVTQLINSAVGLLIIPQQKQYDKIVDGIVSEELLQDLQNCVVKNTYPQNLNLGQIARHIRNSIAHARFEFIAEKLPQKSKPIQIRKVVFKDEDERRKYEFEISLTVELLEKFFFAFSDAAANLS